MSTDHLHTPTTSPEPTRPARALWVAAAMTALIAAWVLDEQLAAYHLYGGLLTLAGGAGARRESMSQLLVHGYLSLLDLIKKVSGSQRETIVREAFKDLLKAWGRQHDLVFLADYPVKTATKTNISVDGALLHELRMPLGYWEAKDAAEAVTVGTTNVPIAVGLLLGVPAVGMAQSSGFSPSFSASTTYSDNDGRSSLYQGNLHCWKVNRLELSLVYRAY